LCPNLQNFNGFWKNRIFKKVLFKEGKTKLNNQDILIYKFCVEFVYIRKKNAMFTTELYSKLKDRLVALRRSL